VTLAAACSLPAYAGKCTKDPLVFTISDSYQDPHTFNNYQAGIHPDGAGDYTDGQNLVSAKLDTCNGNLAQLAPGPTRYVTFDFRNVVATNLNSPTWTASPALDFYISNILYNYNPAATYTFDSYLKTTLKTTVSATIGNGYFFFMENPNAPAPVNPPDSIVNSPCSTSLVHVQHIPATDLTKETWIVWPDSDPLNSCGSVTGSPVQVGTIEGPNSTRKGGQSTVNAGQFVVPFYITIRRP
jgi:hypothetical protein